MRGNHQIATVRSRVASATEWRASPIEIGAIQYVKSGSGHIAFQVLNDAPADIVFLNESVMPMEALHDNAHTAAFLARWADWGRVILFDRRGVGLSDPAESLAQLTIDDFVDDAIAVLDAIGSERATVFSAGPLAGLIALQLAARFPRRVSFLSLYDAIARYRWAPDHPWGVTADTDQRIDEQLTADGRAPRLADRHGRFAATAAHHPGFVEWALTWFRRGAAPTTNATHAQLLRSGDVRAALPAITCPTFIINHAGIEDGHFLNDHIGDTRYVELHDPCHLLFSAELDRVMAIAGEFVDQSPVEPAPRRVLSTVLVTDMVDSPAGVAATDSRQWNLRVDQHHEIARRHLELFDGREIKTPRDGVVASFDSPSSAVMCALAICEESAQRRVTVRAGVHSGEVDMNGADVSGVSVQIAQRMCSLAAGAQTLVTQRVVDLVDVSELRFEHLGDQNVKELKGRLGVFGALRAPRRFVEVVGANAHAAARASADAQLHDLSPREREVLVAVAAGASNAQIASRLHMSAATVKAHVSHLFVKLGCTNRVQLAILAHDAGVATG
jgi:DNA-binding CsgD family transcriptional regulator/class 3 adenylate cyclase